MTQVRTHARHVLLMLFVWILIIFIQLGYIQIQQHQLYAHYAQQQSHMTLHAQPERAMIYDRNGKPLVHNQQRKALCIAPAECRDREQLRTYIATYFPDRLSAFNNAPHAHFMYLRRHPSREQVERVQKDEISDIFYIHEAERTPAEPSLQSFVGLTDSDNHGISGLEYYFDTQLRGQPGTYHLYHDARTHGLHFKKQTQTPQVPGTPITTTIDSTLQFLVHQIVDKHVTHHNASLGAAVVIDPQTGDIHSLTQVGKEPQSSLMPVTQTYELGSVIKAFLMAAALEAGVTTPDEQIWCRNTEHTTINGMPITTWRADGNLSFADVIRFSNNIGTALIAQRIGKQLYAFYRRFGLDEPTHVTFPGEQAGYITPPQHWSLASPLSLSFGYEIRTTLLQLARAFSMFANDGHLAQLRVTHPENSPQWSDQRCSSENIAQAREILSIDKTGSTARRGHIPGYTIYGKTGSAYLISNGTYDHSRSIYTFVGLVEHGAYQRIIVTCIKEPHSQNRYAATVAVPLFKAIAQEMLLHDNQIYGGTYEHRNTS